MSERELLEKVAYEMNAVMGLKPKIVIGEHVSNDQLRTQIEENSKYVGTDKDENVRSYIVNSDKLEFSRDVWTFLESNGHLEHLKGR